MQIAEFRKACGYVVAVAGPKASALPMNLGNATPTVVF
jgi:hypothetical protein